ncbi:MAG: hypothetical protein JOY81_04600 [Alphaproteobacteria bacterium]|nr:hypothetical protein [Alphaproteobacteria bacterium]
MIRTVLTLGSLLAPLLALAACATVPLAPPQADQEGKRFDPPAQDAGVLYVYRGAGLMASARRVDVGVAGGFHAELAMNTYFRLEGPPGPVHVECKTDNTAGRQIAMNAGEIHYAEVVMHAGVFGPSCSVEEVPSQRGQAAIMQSKRVTPH